MRTILAAVLAALSLAGPAVAQDWYVQGGPEGKGSDAVACLPGEFDQIATSLCVYVGCDAGEAPRLGFGLQQVPLPPETLVRVAVDGREVADFVLSVPEGLPGGATPISGQEALLDALRTGNVARVSLGTVGGWRDYELQLPGAGEAIDSALAACPGFAEDPSQASAGRASADPAADAIAENEAFCEGDAAVGPGLVRLTDVDGDGVNDVLLDFLALTCNGRPDFCGTGGCTQEVWLGSREGAYRRLLTDLIVDLVVLGPGRLRVVMDGGDCGLSGAETCEYDYRVENGALRPLD